MSVLRLTPIVIDENSTVCTMSAGSTYCRYSCVEPEIAPPNRYTKRTTKMIGWNVTSKSCSGVRLIRRIVRWASARLCRTSGNGRPVPGSAPGGSAPGGGTVTAVMRRAPRSWW